MLFIISHQLITISSLFLTLKMKIYFGQLNLSHFYKININEI